MELLRLPKRGGFGRVWGADRHLPIDFKYIEEDTALRYSKAKDYPMRAKTALTECVRQCPSLEYKEGILQKRRDSSTFAPSQSGLPGEKSSEICLPRVWRKYFIQPASTIYPLWKSGSLSWDCQESVWKEYEKWINYAEELGIQMPIFRRKKVPEKLYSGVYRGRI